MYVQDEPTTVKIEFTEGCNLRCNFCALQGIREPGPDKKYKFAQPATIDRITKEMARLEWNARIELAMHGEPSMNPMRAELISIIRANLPRASIMMTSNGGGILGQPGPALNLQQMFDAGLNIYALDDYTYDGLKIGAKVQFALKTAFGKKPPFEVFHYPKQKEDPHSSPYVRAKPGERRLIIIQDISDKDTASNVRKLHNTAGVSAPWNDDAQGKRCARPFRELAFRWDGNVGACCNDWRGVFKAGNIHEMTLDEIWQGPAFQSLRKFMYHGMRTEAGAPCGGCDSTSKRVGLLPDRMGKKSLPKPGPEDYKNMKKATKGDSYTAPVLRPWEVEYNQKKGEDK
jgi:MoaA/NifB/PqqE/SkfB family radical SAM enzyme